MKRCCRRCGTHVTGRLESDAGAFANDYLLSLTFVRELAQPAWQQRYMPPLRQAQKFGAKMAVARAVVQLRCQRRPLRTRDG
jgi:hypothetical protein